MKLTPGGVELRYTTPNGKAMAMATLFQLQDQLSDTPEGLPAAASRIPRLQLARHDG